MVIEPNNLIIIGVVLTLIGGFTAGLGGWLQNVHQSEVEREMRIKAETTLQSVNDTLGSVTGGDSFCYVNFQADSGSISNFAVVSHGRYPMYDVSLRLYDPDDFAVAESTSVEEFLKKDLLHLEVGNIAVSEAKSFPETKKLNMRGK